MKPYSQLTPIGKKRRLRRLIMLALKEYDIEVKSLYYYTEETNIFYKLFDTNDNKYVIKIFREEASTLEDNLAEVYFLNQLNKHCDIIVPQVVKSRDNNSVVVIKSELFDVPKRIAVYKWVEGKLFSDCNTKDEFYILGKAMAKFHLAGEGIDIPDDMDFRKWNEVCYFRDEVLVYKDEKYKHFLDEDFYNIMDFIIPYMNKRLPKYYENTKVQLIHGDINPWNILVHKGDIRFIDFEDNILGTPLHDIAIALFYYRHSKNYDYISVRERLLSGYREIKALPEIADYDLDLLIYARLVNFMNYVLVIDEDSEEYCGKWIKSVKEFIEKYAWEEYREYCAKIG